jgi:hypothetical protein
MSIRIIAKGGRLFKQDMDRAEGEVEIHGDEKSFYLKELGKIDSGQGGGARITNAHRDYCECQECNGNLRCEECGAYAVERGTGDHTSCPEQDCQGICRDDRYREEEAVNRGY